MGMEGFFVGLINFIINFYIFLFFVRMFMTTRERYDSILGMVYRATDPVLGYIGSSFRLNQVNLAPVLVIVVLLILKGLLFRSIPGALLEFFSFLFQVYALTLIVIMSYREYFVNPIINFAQRLVNPIRAIAANLSSNLLLVNLLSLVIVIVLHTFIVFILNGLMGLESEYPVKVALLTSLFLILDLTVFFIRVIIINAILSWVSPDPMNPLVQLLNLLSAPIVDPFRRFIPPLAGMLDLSPIAAILALMFARQMGAGLLSLI
jgi:YggT family protein